MSRLVMGAALVLLSVFAFAMGVHSIVSQGGVRTDPFQVFAAHMPGEQLPDNISCQYHEGIYQYQTAGAYCQFTPPSVCAAGRVYAQHGEIIMMAVYSCDLTFGELVAEFGRPERIGRYRKSFSFSWPDLTMFAMGPRISYLNARTRVASMTVYGLPGARR